MLIPDLEYIHYSIQISEDKAKVTQLLEVACMPLKYSINKDEANKDNITLSNK